MRLTLSVLSSIFVSAASALTIAEINGNKFLSPYSGQAVNNVTGLVTAKGANGFYLRSTTPDSDLATSESIYVFGASTTGSVSVGDIVTLGATVSEYRSSSNYIFLTELTSATGITVISSGNTVTPVVLGSGGRSPPTEQYTSLDGGDVFAVPNAVNRVSTSNPVLQPTIYGLDFWESLSGELVSLSGVRAVSRPNQYGDTWVVGNWPTTGDNGHGGLTVTNSDANPETILVVGTALDGSSNPDDTKLGDRLADITGIISYNFGEYTLTPGSALKVTSPADSSFPPTNLVSSSTCSGISIGQYNVENLSPQSSQLPAIASQIAQYLRSPDLLYIQEVQDNNGPTNDDVTDANVTLSDLVAAIAAAGGKQYEYVNIDPVDDTSGGEPGGNIRNAYLWNPAVMRLRNPNRGSSTVGTQVVDGHLTNNPGLIDPQNSAWDNSRRPLAAEWETLDGTNSTFFSVNVHWTSKGGGSTIMGDPRPPINGGVAKRNTQAQITGGFIAQILSQDANAKVISAGDYNEFSFVQPMETFTSVSGLQDLDVAAGIPEVERYTYVFEMNSQQLDHMHVSNAIAAKSPQFEHIHISSWVSFDDQISDHDPSVAKLNVCAAGGSVSSSSSASSTSTSSRTSTSSVTSTSSSSSSVSTSSSRSSSSSASTSSSSSRSSSSSTSRSSSATNTPPAPPTPPGPPPPPKPTATPPAPPGPPTPPKPTASPPPPPPPPGPPAPPKPSPSPPAPPGPPSPPPPPGQKKTSSSSSVVATTSTRSSSSVATSTSSRAVTSSTSTSTPVVVTTSASSSSSVATSTSSSAAPSSTSSSSSAVVVTTPTSSSSTVVTSTSSSVVTSSTSSSSLVSTTQPPTTLTTITTPSTSSTSSSAPATSTSSIPFVGAGNLYIDVNGARNGQVLTDGSWYRGGGTPATIRTNTTTGDGPFTINTSKGLCAVLSNATFTCGVNVATGTAFTANGSFLAYDGSSVFGAESTPSGTARQQIQAGAGYPVSLMLEWVARP